MAPATRRKAIDKAIDELIEGDEQLRHIFGLMTSIPGIGTATATEVIIASNELQTITDPKKMACHAGVAPFNYQSGSSVRGRPGVSQHARKRPPRRPCDSSSICGGEAKRKI